MPEGDTIARIAVTLRDALVGHRVERFESPIPALRDTDLEGRTIASVEARGKNLLIAFDDARTLHTHLRMSGTWHLYGLHSSWRKSAKSALVTITTDDRVAVMFREERAGAPPIIRLLSADALRRDRMLRSLGPDVMATTFDVDEAVRRVHASVHKTIAEALLDQRDVAGIGNVYKSELLFLAGVDPRRAPKSVPIETLRALLVNAREIMLKHVQQSRRGRFAIQGRVTRFRSGEALWVYGRARKPCLRCRAPIRSIMQGLDRRSTYWCPKCQT
ncbi:MAG TPA: DNA-formamidopyrimidine glycosylase family protein [Polyangiaceae bacterium]